MKRTARGRGRGERPRIRLRASSRSAPTSAIALALVVTALIGSNALGPAPTELVIEPELLTRLQTLAEGLHREIVLCLQGRVSRGRALVNDFVMPLPKLSTPTRSSFERCPRGTLASWHNHPRAMIAPAVVGGGARAASTHTARRLCVLSETDIRTAERLRHPFVVVSVDARTWCWWGLSEVDQFAERAISPGPPSPERIARADDATAWAQPSTVSSTQ